MENPGYQKIFDQFANKENLLENKAFNKIFKDSNLIGKQLSSTDLDIIFAKNKKKEAKKMQLAQFKSAFDDVAKHMKMQPQQLMDKCSSGPVFVGTKAENVALHDDKNLYTGVYGKGGPTTVDKGRGIVSDLSELANRKDHNVRGVNKDIKQM